MTVQDGNEQLLYYRHCSDKKLLKAPIHTHSEVLFIHHIEIKRSLKYLFSDIPLPNFQRDANRRCSDEYITAACFPFNNKIEKNYSGAKTTVKKAPDHSDMDMFTPALQFGTLVKSPYVYLYSTLYNRQLLSKQLYSIEHGKTCF